MKISDIKETYLESGAKSFFAYLFILFGVVFPISTPLSSFEISPAESCSIAGISLGIGLFLSAIIIEQNMYKKAKTS